jgi:hypothetical protein
MAKSCGQARGSVNGNTARDFLLCPLRVNVVSGRLKFSLYLPDPVSPVLKAGVENLFDRGF